MNKSISKLHFITYQDIDKSPSEQVTEYCAGGGSWVQLRMKNVSKEEVKAEAIQCYQVCMEAQATFVINDYVDVANEIGADGVHIGKSDMSVAEARAILGPTKIIGATANTFEDIVAHAKNGADYVGLGPFKFTGTKKNLSPILGVEGYQAIIQKCKDAGIHIPIIAIGGIVPDDLAELFATGIYGIAQSSYIAKAENIGMTTLDLLQRVGKLYSKNFKY